MRERWMLRNPKANLESISKECGISRWEAALCANRGLVNKNDINKFLNPSLEDLYDGRLMKDCAKGVGIIKEAILNKNKMVIYGDYDCDGVISTYILYSALKDLGAVVDYYIPSREEEGYGMNSSRVEKLKEEGYQVILTCDNGISAFEQVKLAVDLGFTVVITDHHDIPFVEVDGEKLYKIPEAHAVINPKQMDCSYPFKLLCGAGIALKFVTCLYEEMGLSKEKAEKYIEYAAIATVCDVVDLLDENRVIVKHGLKMLNDTKNLGLKALIKETSIENKKISAYHLGFIIGPEINATGRLETAALAVELLLSDNEYKAKELAVKLHELNTERQALTQSSVEDLEEQLKASFNPEHRVILLYSPLVHESIAGIAAGRIKEKYNLPTIVLTKGKEVPKGSARSIEGYNLFEELSKCKELMEKFGGHPMAAGLSIKEENIDVLRETLNNNCTLTAEDVLPKVRIDTVLPIREVSYDLIERLELYEPFGKGNSTPAFAEKNIEITRLWYIGKEKNILKCRLRIPNSGLFIEGISFDKGEDFKEQLVECLGEAAAEATIASSFANLRADIVFYPSINEFNGVKSLQLIIKGIRLSGVN